MQARLFGKILWTIVAGALLAAVVAIAAPASASASPPIAVDFTVHEALPIDGTRGVMMISDVAGCGIGSTVDSTGTATFAGPVTIFEGTKVFNCDGDDTFTLTYRARVRGCSATDSGTWKIVDGTGLFAGAKGHGRLVGSYTFEGGTGDACTNDGIDDRYTGKIKLP